jgi:hypothetical protein
LKVRHLPHQERQIEKKKESIMLNVLEKSKKIRQLSMAIVCWLP